MTKEQVLEAVKNYTVMLECEGARPIRNQEAKSLDDRENHLLWMCTQIEPFLNEGRVAKAMRWLGFLQGALWFGSYRTIEDLKKDNKPPDEEFNKDRV